MPKKTAHIGDQARALSERGRPNGPALADLAGSTLDEIQEACERCVEACEAVRSSFDEYDNADEGREGAEDRAEAWDGAQSYATELADAVDDIIGALALGIGQP